MKDDYVRRCEALYRKQQGFSVVRDYYRINLANSLIKRNLPLPVDDTHLFNDWLSLYQESTMIHGNWGDMRKEFLRICQKLVTG